MQHIKESMKKVNIKLMVLIMVTLFSMTTYKCEAADEYGLTGTYADEERNYWLEIVAEEDGDYTYKFYSSDESDYDIERNCYISGGTVFGELSALTYNIGGTFTYNGDLTVEYMQKISDDADINNALSYDLYTDVRDALLYYNYAEDAVCDSNWDVIPEYNYITAAPEENRLLINGELSYDYSLTYYDRIIYAADEYTTDEWYGEEYNEQSSLIEALGASWDRCNTEVADVDWKYSDGIVRTQVVGDGNSYDEIILNAWFDENHNPIATYMPKELTGYNYVKLATFCFVDNDFWTITNVKRSPGSYENYALVLTNIQKDSDSWGNMYIRGYDFFTGEQVVAHGKFEGVLNGDNVLVVCTYQGLATDDTLNLNCWHYIYGFSVNNQWY